MTIESQQPTDTPAPEQTATPAASPPSGLRDMGARPGAPPPAAQPPAERPAAPPRTSTADLPPEAMAARLDRQKRQLLRDLGIDDVAKFKAERDAERKELARLKEQEDAGKRAQMSELQRLQADLEAERKAKEAAEARARDLEEIRVAHEQEAVVRTNALRHVDPEMYDYARLEFQRHVRDLEKRDPKKLAALDDDYVDRFFKDLVKKKPKFAPQAPAAGVPPKQQEIKPPPPAGARPRPGASGRSAERLPGAPLRQPPGAAGSPPNGGKTARPGQPNSMTKAELRAHLKSKGYRTWS